MTCINHSYTQTFTDYPQPHDFQGLSFRLGSLIAVNVITLLVYLTNGLMCYSAYLDNVFFAFLKYICYQIKGSLPSTHRGQYYGIGFEKRRSFIVRSTNKETGDKAPIYLLPWGAVKLVSCGRAAGSRRAGGADSHRRALGLGHAWLGVGKGLQHWIFLGK